MRELSPRLADPTFHGSAISISSSEDEEDRRQAARRKRQRLLVNWRESLPSTSSQGYGDENLSPARGPARKRKAGPGRPKGSKNKVKPTSKTQNKTASSNGSGFNSCNICKEKKEGPFCMTDCGHFYHNDCLDSSASNLCSVCGPAFQKTIPFFG
ncbi:hypothetical protein FOCC_FOCC012451 [Frankliniella occidentalis]|nr:hypothetical protein FOCC_FOCC012451 [Frankliniella occidentalis]